MEKTCAPKEIASNDLYVMRLIHPIQELPSGATDLSYIIMDKISGEDAGAVTAGQVNMPIRNA